MAEIRMPAGGNGEHREVANLSLIKGDREHSVAASTQEAGFDYAIVDANTASLTKAVAKRIRADLQQAGDNVAMAIRLDATIRQREEWGLDREGRLTRPPELMAARRAIALGKLIAFNTECWRLAALVQSGVVTITDAVDTLAEADVANDISATFGADFVQGIMSDAFVVAGRTDQSIEGCVSRGGSAEGDRADRAVVRQAIEGKRNSNHD